MSIIDAYELEELIMKAERVDFLESQFSELRGGMKTALIGLRRSHLLCNDAWYSCPMSIEGCADERAGSECNCGADEHNAKVDAALRLLADA